MSNIDTSPEALWALVNCWHGRYPGDHDEAVDIGIDMAAALRAVADEKEAHGVRLTGEAHIEGWRLVPEADEKEAPAVPRVEDLLVWAAEDGVIRLSQCMDADLQDALVKFVRRFTPGRVPQGRALLAAARGHRVLAPETDVAAWSADARAALQLPIQSGARSGLIPVPNRAPAMPPVQPPRAVAQGAECCVDVTIPGPPGECHCGCETIARSR